MGKPKTRHILNPSLAMDLKLTARRKNTPMTELTSDFLAQPHIAKVIGHLASLDSNQIKNLENLPATLKRHADFFLESGLFIPEDDVPETVVPKWELSRRLLSRLPDERRAQAQHAKIKGRCFFNVDCVVLQDGKKRPDSKISGLPPARTFPAGPNIVWVYDPATQMWAAYQISAALFKSLQKIKTDDSLIKKLDASTFELFWQARILAAPGDFKRRKRLGDARLREVQKTVEHEEYAVVHGLINDLQIAALHFYFQAREREGYLDFDEEQVIKMRYKSHNDPLLTFLHRQSGNLLRRATRELLIPSYSMLSAYLPGAALKEHTDRPQCAWNCSLLFDSRTADNGSTKWPIFIKTKNAIREINLNLGDAVIYRGTSVPHWRNALQPGQRQTLALFHYVPIDFQGSLD